MKIIFIMYLFSTAILLNAQNLSISGSVKDTSGLPIAGANIILTGTKLGTVTDFNGNYVISKLNPGQYEIRISNVGYTSIKIPKIELREKAISLNIILHQTAIQSAQVVVTASKYKQRISDLPVSAEIISSNELSKKNILSLSDVMRYAPGVSMIDDQISIRGSSGYSRGAGTRVLMEIDGIPYYTGDTGDIVWNAIPVTQIDHIEIIKGAASSLYGSSAIGGVVNVITKNIPPDPETYIKTSFGFYDKPSYSIWQWSKELRTFTGLTISHSQSYGNFHLSLSLTRLSDMSYIQNDFYTRYVGFFKGNLEITPNSILEFFINSLNQDNGNFLYWKDSRNVLIPPDADQGESVFSNRYMFGINYKDILSENVYLNIRGSYYNTYWHDQTSSFNSSKTNLYSGEIQATSNLGSGVVLVSGIESATSQVKSNIFANPFAYSFGIYSQLDFKIKQQLSFSTGLRYDYSRLDTISSFNAVSPKLGMNYRVSDRLSFRSSFGTGFRAPTLAEAFTTTSASGITIKPNPYIKPEKNWNLEFGANLVITNNINFDCAVFQNEFFDFIEPTVDPKDGLIFFDNITRARIQGAEVNLNSDFLSKKLHVSLNYIYLWARDLQLNQDLKYRPRNSVTASVDYLYCNIDFGADFRYWSKVQEMDFELVNLGLLKDGRNQVAVYVLDLRAVYNLKLIVLPSRVSFNVNNVLNYNYVELIGNLAPIRNYSISLEFSI